MEYHDLLEHEPSPFAIAEMVAALEDEDERIRWIAGLALLSRNDERVSAMLTTFIKQTQSSAARASAQDWLRRMDNQS